MSHEHGLGAKTCKKHQNAKNSNYACVCMWCACGVHEVCLGDAWQGRDMHNWVKVCKSHTQWSKYVKQDQSWVIPKFGTHLSPKQLKNVTWAFCQTLDMQHYT